MALRTRVLLGMTVIAAMLALSALAITRSTRANLIHQVDAQLQDAQPQVRSLIGNGPPTAQDGPTPRLSNLYVGILRANGVLTTLHAPDLRDQAAPAPVLGAADLPRLAGGGPATVPGTEGGSRYRVQAIGETRNGAALVVGLTLDDVDESMRRLIAVEAFGLLSALAVLALVTWWVIRLGVQPIRRMTTTAEAIAGGDLSQRVEEGTPGTEAGALGVALNGMLGRIEEAFEQRSASEGRLRRFVADASHELRTPITTIRGYAEMFRNGALDDSTELSEAMRRTEQESVRMGGLVEDLLRLARLDEGRPLDSSPVDLGMVSDDAVRDARAAAPERVISLNADRAVMVTGNEDGMRQVVANLLGNALVHAPDAAITVRVHTEGDRAVLEVADDGPGMSRDDGARAFERFYRADPSRSRHKGGSGLGLSIVDATVRAHGGTVSLVSDLGAGVTVRVELPLQPADAPAAAVD